MLDCGRNIILFSPFGGLSDEVPPVFPFLRLCFERLVVVRVSGGGISDDLGRDRDGGCCVGYGSHLHLSYCHDEAPEEIQSDSWRRCVFVSVALTYLRPRCHYLIGRNIGWVW